MEKQPAWVLALIVACAMFGVGCLDSVITDDVADEAGEEVEDERLDDAVDETTIEQESSTSCATPSSVYDAFENDGGESGTVAQYPWRGASSTYPSGNEDFRGYATSSTVECSSAKSKRSHLDVTSGCLSATSVSGNPAGKISTNNFRALALGKTAVEPDAPVKWTAQRVEYRFYYSTQTSTVGNPGFKAFARYRTENDLYVASWRMDGVVQIQKKQCGKYTTLAVLPKHGAPSKNAWHTIRFDAIGDRLTLALDGREVLAVTSGTFSWGTAGIRIDSASGAYVDDWHVSAP